MGIDSEKLVVVTVGCLSKEKGFDILIQSFADLLQTGLEATLLIAGAGPERFSRNSTRPCGCICLRMFRSDRS